MPKAIDCRDRIAAGDGEPGAATRAVAGKLAAHGFDVRGPDGEGAGPDRLAGLMMHLLAADRADPPRQGTGTRNARAGLQGSQSHAPLFAPSHNRGTAMADEWPLRDSIEFGALPGAVPCARLHARLVLAEWRLSGLSEQVELVVSELVTNAVAASRSLEWVFPVRLWLLSDRTRVLIAVWDAHPRLPVRVEANELAESGRGLQLVDTITTHWDAYATPQAGGKIVRAICAMEQSASSQT